MTAKNMKDLIGKKIIKMEVSEDTEQLIIETQDSIYTYKAIGDCCSSSWIEHIDDIDSIIGQTIIGIIDSDSAPKDDEDLSNYDCLQVYKTTLKTDKTSIDIEYRNHSNGYYGGWLELARIEEKNNAT